jgi:DNA polymerase-3 subunit delta'
MVLSNLYFGVNDWFAKISGDAKQGMIYGNESDEIIRKLNLKTYESEYKVMIIWLPEKMNIACANKLLKILEEPPEKTVFLLVSNEPDNIITTILSRTQHIHIPRLSENEITNALLKNDELEIENEDAIYAAHIANGSYLSALAVLNDGDENKANFERFMMIMRLAWNVGNKKDHASLKTLKKWSDDMAAASMGRERQKNFLSYAQRMTRENFILNLQQPGLSYLTSTEAGFSQRFSPFINERNVEEIMIEFALAERQIEQNVNAKMIFFDLTLKIIMLLKK